MTEPSEQPSDRQIEVTRRTRLRRRPERGVYDRSVIDAILDEGLVGQLGFAIDGHPWTVPMVYGRVADVVFVHGAAANHALRALAGGIEVCLSVTLLDGLVVARSAFHMSINYRSVMLFGVATRVEDPERKRAAMEAVLEHVVPGRTPDVRPPSAPELAATLVLELAIVEASAKIRTGGPVDEPEDLARSTWAGEIPLSVRAGAPVPDGHVRPGIVAPEYASRYQRPGSA